MPTIVLSAICLVVALLLSTLNLFTAEIIADAQREKEAAALREVYPGGEFGEDAILDISGYNLSEAVTEVYAEQSGGYVFKLTVKGYKDGLVIMCGIDTDGKILGVKHTASNETYGYEDELNGAYVGKDSSSASLIIATGASAKSNTSHAYYRAITAALEAFSIIEGGQN